MSNNSSKPRQKLDLEDVIEREPDSKHGTEGETANQGLRAGPNSDQAGKPQAPQVGNPRSPDRRPN